MKNDARIITYFSFLQFFIFSMLGVAISGNLFQIFVFWELVGLASYLLIGFWYEKEAATRANQKAFLMNRIGDAGFLMGILMFFQHFHTFQFTDPTTINNNNVSLSLMGICLFAGTIGKSAQFPLQSWLPDAMEGPTPVSALIHAATMVAAGVFLGIRIFPVLTPDALLFITLIGASTMLLAAIKAISQTDIKKVLAYSTISQLGLMVLAIGVGSPNAALFHLCTHAFFKAGLFLCAGAVIHATHTQDMTQLGGLRKELPIVFYSYIICGAALAGLPLFSGFLSKDAILIALAAWAETQGTWAWLIVLAVLLSSVLTATYMCQQIKALFFGETRHENIQKPEWQIQTPLLILGVLSLGFVFSVNPVSLAGTWFFSIFGHDIAQKWHALAYLGTACAVLGGFWGWHRQLSSPKTNVDVYDIGGKLTIVYSRSVRKIDENIIDGIVNGLSSLQIVLSDIAAWFDKNVIDGLVNGFAQLLKKIGNYTRQIQGGQVQQYISYLFIGILVLVFFVVVS